MKDLQDFYKDKKVKLVQYPKFVLMGKITEVFDDCIRFKTKTQESLIDFKAIKEISFINGSEED